MIKYKISISRRLLSVIKHTALFFIKVFFEILKKDKYQPISRIIFKNLSSVIFSYGILYEYFFIRFLKK